MSEHVPEAPAQDDGLDYDDLADEPVEADHDLDPSVFIEETEDGEEVSEVGLDVDPETSAGSPEEAQ